MQGYRNRLSLTTASENSAIATSKLVRILTSRKFIADAASMAIFWTVVYTPVFLYTSRSIEAALVGLGSSTILEIALGGVYGKFLDWFRRKLGVATQASSHISGS
jgi:hypothetical protein